MPPDAIPLSVFPICLALGTFAHHHCLALKLPACPVPPAPLYSASQFWKRLPVTPLLNLRFASTVFLHKPVSLLCHCLLLCFCILQSSLLFSPFSFVSSVHGGCWMSICCVAWHPAEGIEWGFIYLRAFSYQSITFQKILMCHLPG
jgi:hypothetical protein